MSTVCVLRADRVSFTYPVLFKPLLTEASFHLTLSGSERSRVGLIGPNGHGKSTLLALIRGALRPDAGQLHAPAGGVRVAHLPQAIIEASAHETLGDFVTAPLAGVMEVGARLRELERALASPGAAGLDAALAEYGALQERFAQAGGYALDARVERVLDGLALARVARSRPLKTLSMGQRTRAALARILLTPAELLVLDEPTNHLDLEALEWLEAYLRGLDVAQVIVSHDRAFIERAATTIWHLEEGHLEVFAGDLARFEAHRRAREAKLRHEHAVQRRELGRLEESLTQRMGWSAKKEREKNGPGVFDRGFIGARAARHAKRAKAIEQRITHEIERRACALPRLRRALELPLEVADPAPEHALSLRRVRIRRGGATLFDGLDLDLGAGDRLAVLGPNGAGKSTLLAVLAGRLEPEAGHRFVAPRARLHHFTQDHAELRTPGARLIDALGGDPRDGAARTLLGVLGFKKDDVLRDLDALSPGQLARVALAVMLRDQANLLLLDEPTNHLDLPAREALEASLQRFPGAVVLVTHDRRLVRALGARVLRLGQPGYEA